MTPAARRGLLIVLALGAALRFFPIWFGLPFDRARPDEETAIAHAVAILAGDANPHFFHWPSLAFYIFAGGFSVASWMHSLWHLVPAVTPNAEYLIARGIVALAGTLTIAVVFAFVRRMADTRTAVVAAVLLAVAPLHVRESHFAMTDVLMTLFVTSAVALAVRAADMTRAAMAGFATGLAASAKYTGVAALATLAAPPYAAGRIGAFLIASVVGFLAATPYALFDFGAFSSGFGFDVTHLATGQASLDVGRGWSYHLLRSLPYGMGPAVFIASLAGLAVMAVRFRREAIAIGAVCATVYVALAPGRTVFFRYVLPMVPLLCIAAAVAIRQAAESIAPRRPILLTSVLATVVALPPLVNSVWMDVLLARTDTRVLAGRWLASRVSSDQAVYDAGGDYAGAFLMGVPAHVWNASTFVPSRNGFVGSGGRLPDWIVLPESPLVYGSVPQQLQRLVGDRYRLADVIVATRGSMNSTIYDVQDAFFMPIAGFTPIVRPGPTLKIYAVRAGAE
jgi:hypothetical protein